MKIKINTNIILNQLLNILHFNKNSKHKFIISQIILNNFLLKTNDI